MRKYLLFIPLILSGCNIGTYQGLTAEEWFNEYDYCDGELTDIQNQLSDTESELEELRDCIDDSGSWEEATNCI